MYHLVWKFSCDDSRDVRTSQGTFMSRHDDPEGVISWIEEKAAQLTGLPVSHGEVRHPVTVTIAVHP